MFCGFGRCIVNHAAASRAASGSNERAKGLPRGGAATHTPGSGSCSGIACPAGHVAGPTARVTGSMGRATGPMAYVARPMGHVTGPTGCVAESMGRATGPMGRVTGPMAHVTRPMGPAARPTGPATHEERGASYEKGQMSWRTGGGTYGEVPATGGRQTSRNRRAKLPPRIFPTRVSEWPRASSRLARASRRRGALRSGRKV